MNWLPTIFFGLLVGLIGGAYGLLVADRAVGWLRISSFEGGSGYFVVFMTLLAFIGSLVIGLVACRLAGGPGLPGIARGFGVAVGIVLAVISLLGGMAWLQADQEPLVAGQSIDVAVEVRFPSGSAGRTALPAPTTMPRSAQAAATRCAWKISDFPKPARKAGAGSCRRRFRSTSRNSRAR